MTKKVKLKRSRRKKSSKEVWYCFNEDDGESSVRAKIASSLKGQYSLLGANDFVKVTQKRILVLRLGENTEYNYSVIGLARTPLYSYKTGIWFCSKWTRWVSSGLVSSFQLTKILASLTSQFNHSSVAVHIKQLGLSPQSLLKEMGSLFPPHPPFTQHGWLVPPHLSTNQRDRIMATSFSGLFPLNKGKSPGNEVGIMEKSYMTKSFLNSQQVS